MEPEKEYIKQMEAHYHEYISAKMKEALGDRFSGIIEVEEAYMLDKFAEVSMNLVHENIGGLKDTPMDEYLKDEFRLALRIGYVLCSLGHSYSLEHSGLERWSSTPVKVSLKTKIRRALLKFVDKIREKLVDK